jgi:hypothetical protein
MDTVNQIKFMKLTPSKREQLLCMSTIKKKQIQQNQAIKQNEYSINFNEESKIFRVIL